KKICEPDHYPVDDSMLLSPPEDGSEISIIRGPNIKPLPVNTPLPECLTATVSLKAGDHVSTDDITPANAQFSSMRSNIPLIAEYAFNRYDPEFVARAKAMGVSILIGGENYGQGSSREHAAITPMFLGVKAVIAKSMARIHKGNLINHGVVPLLFSDPADYDALSLADELEIADFPAQLRSKTVTVLNRTTGRSFQTTAALSDDEVEILLCGGQLAYMKKALGR
ncbi:MAG: aconitate hydratase, partial [Oscillospiraceae bacterium]